MSPSSRRTFVQADDARTTKRPPVDYPLFPKNLDEGLEGAEGQLRRKQLLGYLPPEECVLMSTELFADLFRTVISLRDAVQEDPYE